MIGCSCISHHSRGPYQEIHTARNLEIELHYLMLEQVGSVVIVMARVLGLLWLRNPLAIVHHREQQALIPACTVLSGRQQPESSKSGDALPAAQPVLH